MNRRTQFALVWFLIGLVVGILFVWNAPHLIIVLIFVAAIVTLAAMAEARYHLMQQFIRKQQASRRRATQQEPPLRASQYQPSRNAESIPQTPRAAQYQQPTTYRRRNVQP